MMLDHWICKLLFPHCPYYSNERPTHLSSLRIIDRKLLDNSDSFPEQLLFVNSSFDTNDNTKTMSSIINHVLSIKTFS